MKSEFLCHVIGLSRFDLGDGEHRGGRIHVIQPVESDNPDKRGREVVRLLMPYEMFETAEKLPLPGLWLITVDFRLFNDLFPEQAGLLTAYVQAIAPAPAGVVPDYFQAVAR